MSTPDPILLTVDRKLRLDPAGLPGGVLSRLRSRLVFPNPKWIENRRRGFSNWRVRRTISCLTETKSGLLVMPRGFAAAAREVLAGAGLAARFDDRTRRCPDVDLAFRGALLPHQERALEKILARRFGVLQAPTGSGKTVIALAAAARRAQPALIVVHSKELLYQWVEAAVRFLGLPADDIGLVGDGKFRLDRPLTIAIVNSLYRRAARLKKQTGFLIVDECHRTPARTFTRAVAAFDSRYMLGLSATPYRKDRLTPLIHLFLGDTVHVIEHRELVEEKVIVTGRVLVRETDFDYDYRDDYPELIGALAADPDRNRRIVSDVAAWAVDGGTALVVSDRLEHCRHLEQAIGSAGVETRLITGALPKRARQDAVSDLKTGRARVLVATLQLIGEGFDLPVLSALFLATPISFTGRIVQTLGRVLRSSRGKTEAVVYDYADRAAILRHAFRKRLRVYRRLGFQVSSGDPDGGMP